MEIPNDRKYSKEHEWALKEEGEVYAVGITAHAVEALGDLVFIELPNVGDKFDQLAKFGEVESVKSVSDLFTPLGGEVVAVNDSVVDDPSVVNDSPYQKGWLVKIKATNPKELDKQMSSEDYQEFIS